ncbi:MAG: hypothetical protein RR404_00120 [Bacilli bacterium]
MNTKEFQDFINSDFPSFSNWLFSLNPYEFTSIATIIGFIISPTLTINQQNSLGNFFELLGQVILTVNAQGVTVKQKRKQNSGISKELEEKDLYLEVKKLKEEVIKLRQDILNNEKT